MDVDFKKFESRPPSHQNAVDIFEGHWASNLDCIAAGVRAASAWHFAPEPRVRHAAITLGEYGRFDGMSILELGPLEGGHTYQLENLGGNVLAIEANAEAYLKCLVAKEIVGSRRARFMYGNFVPYLAETNSRFDIVFACGVLYHMEDPISVIQSIARVTNKCFVWAAVYDPTRPAAPSVLAKRDARFPGIELYTLDYGTSPQSAQFWGGIAPISTWMRSEDMKAIFQAVGFSRIEPLDMPPTEGHGVACFSATK